MLFADLHRVAEESGHGFEPDAFFEQAHGECVSKPMGKAASSDAGDISHFFQSVLPLGERRLQFANARPEQMRVAVISGLENVQHIFGQRHVHRFACLRCVEEELAVFDPIALYGNCVGDPDTGVTHEED